ncbi:MAG: metallophosphoesterase [Haloarculaceae archaeon]
MSDPDGLELRDRAVHLPETSTLVLADVHLGKDAASNVELRLGEHEDVTGRFAALVGRFEPEEVVVAGDLLHSFSTLPRGVMETLEELRTTAREVGARIVVTPGNHDTMLDELWKGPTGSEYRVGDWLVTHGHEEPEGVADRYLVGHDHPAIEIEGRRQPCYLYGEGIYRGADVLVLPAFTRLAAGTPVNGARNGDLMSPLAREVDAFRPLVRDEAADETLTFPPLSTFRRML